MKEKEKYNAARPDYPGLPDLKDLARWTAGSPHTGPAIMMGDFNAPRSIKYGPEEVEYGKMVDIFNSVGAFDAYRHLHKVNHPTVERPKNLLGQIFWGRKPTAKCLDYVFVKPAGGGLTIVPEKAEVLHDWKYKLKLDDVFKDWELLRRAFKWPTKLPPMDLSDHYPLRVTFKVCKSDEPRK